MKIVEIRKITHVKLKNLHDNRVSFGTDDILEIKFEDGSVRMVDLFMEQDITDVDYAEILPTRRTKTIILMHDILEDDRI